MRGWVVNLDVASMNAERTVIPLVLKAATPVGAVSNTVTSSGSTFPERRNSFSVSVYKGDNVTLSYSTRTTEKDSIRLDGFSFLHCNNCILTPSMKVHSLSLLGIESSHELTVLVRWNQLSVGLQSKSLQQGC